MTKLHFNNVVNEKKRQKPVTPRNEYQFVMNIYQQRQNVASALFHRAVG